MKAEELIAWADKLPGWQSDALRRLWTQEVFTDHDFQEVMALLKSHHQIAGTDSVSLEPIRFQSDHIALVPPTSKRTSLQAMYAVEGVNALSTGQRIEFDPTGLTVIYGDNASGKSGYSRVLKRACRSRGVTEPIYPNVYQSAPYPVPQATFDVLVDDKPVDPLKWQENTTAPEHLSDIAVFDTKCARVYVNEANDVHYMPYGLDVFTKLASLCARIRTIVQAEIAALPNPPAILDKFVGEKLVFTTLTADTKPEQIREKAKFDDQDRALLRTTTKTLADLIANDPRKRAEVCLRLKTRVDQLRRTLTSLKIVISSKAANRIRSLLQEMLAAQAALKLASNKAFQKEPLPGTGNSIWRVMFNAAQHFSEKHAYPDQQFPVTSDGSLCPLCQQPLQSTAQDRLIRFWEFIQADTSRVATEKKQQTDVELADLRRHVASTAIADKQLLVELDEIEPGTGSLVEAFLQSVQLRLSSLDQSLSSSTWAEPPALSPDPNVALSRISKHCSAEDRRFRKMEEPKERDSLEKTKSELELRKALHENLDTVLSHVERLKKQKVLGDCHKSADTNSITRKQSEFMAQALTSELKTALTTELQTMGVDHITIQLESSGSLGKTLHRLALASQTSQRIGLADILSEGEHRVIAIAAFLAELAISPHRSSIIFDDPVSSLDHNWREAVARRLVTEGTRRQVIIFTHDIAFLLSLHYEAGLQQVSLKTQTLARIRDEVGICDPELPWPAMNTRDRISYLRRLSVEIGRIRKTGDSKLLDRTICYFYGRLREAWERAIEEVLLGDVIQRFRREMETQKLASVTVTDEDYRTVSTAIKKCSGLMAGHDQPAGASLTQPSNQILDADITNLDDFVKTLNSRKKEVAESRKDLLKPPTTPSAPKPTEVRAVASA